MADEGDEDQGAGQGQGGRFTGLSGVLAGCAAAIGGLIAILIQVGLFNGDDTTVVTPPPPPPPPPAFPATDAADPPARTDWAAQANAICEKTHDAHDALPTQESLVADPAALARAGGESVDLNQRQLRELQKLSPPENDAPKVKRLLRLLAQTNDIAEEMIAGLRVGDVSSYRVQLARLTPLAKSADDLANELGATTCAEGASYADTDVGGGP